MGFDLSSGCTNWPLRDLELNAVVIDCGSDWHQSVLLSIVIKGSRSLGKTNILAEEVGL